MKMFYGGQIEEKCRGKLAIVIAKDKSLMKYDSFLYEPNSDEFIFLTGIRSISFPLERVYLGVSYDAGEQIIKRTVNKNFDKVDVQSIDKLVVIPYFLDKI